MAHGKLPIFERRADDGRLMGYQVKIRKQGFPTVNRQFDRKAEAERFALDTLQAMTARTWTDRREAERTTLAAALDQYKVEVTATKKTAYGEGLLIERLKKTRSRNIASPPFRAAILPLIAICGLVKAQVPIPSASNSH